MQMNNNITPNQYIERRDCHKLRQLENERSHFIARLYELDYTYFEHSGSAY